MKMRGHTDSQAILVIIDGRIVTLNGLKKRTTCNDVINMAAASTGDNVKGSELGVPALFESSNGVERVLSPHTNIWKVIRSWGNDTSYSLVLKPTDRLKKKMEAVSRGKRNLDKLRSAISFKKSNINEQDIAHNLDNDLKTTTATKSLSVFEDKPDNLCEKKGKLALIHRYISDVISHKSKPVIVTAPHNSSRTHGDGSSFFENRNDVDSSDYNNLGAADINVTYTISSAEEHTYTMDCEHTDDHMNMAFVNETLTKSDIPDILNERIHDDKSIISDESGFDDVSICSVDEMEKNIFDCEFDLSEVYCSDGWLQEGRTPLNNTVIKHEFIRNIFRKKGGLTARDLLSLDDSLASFMNTRVNEADDDEALSSLGSDFGSV